jgi:hypothetical protein
MTFMTNEERTLLPIFLLLFPPVCYGILGLVIDLSVDAFEKGFVPV